MEKGTTAAALGTPVQAQVHFQRSRVASLTEIMEQESAKADKLRTQAPVLFKTEEGTMEGRGAAMEMKTGWKEGGSVGWRYSTLQEWEA